MKKNSPVRPFLLYLAVIAAFVAASYILVFSSPSSPLHLIESPTRSRLTKDDLPILNQNSFPVISAQGALIVDVDSSVILYEKNPDGKLLPASTTKIMTALISLEHFSHDAVITVGKIKTTGQQMKLVPGEKITALNLLYGLLVYSANDAAEVLADSYPGGREAFINAMNEKAKTLHLNETHFSNPTGLDEANHYSSARDLVRISEFAMRNDLFARVVGTKQIVIKSVDGKFVHNLKNINSLLGVIPGVEGVKTGWTEGARENLVTLVNRDGRKILIAILGSQDRFGETKELIDWVYKTVAWSGV